MVDIQKETSKQNADAQTTPPNATLAHLVTEIQSLKDSNTRMARLLERILAQQDEITRQQVVVQETLHAFVGSDPAE